ncbi:YceD family protein [Pseudogracilibacillus sp. ICA-222130]|uniref:YceD family protein n=1 Tax=Pseudogracilibacillus sp. ICA-222130 TaxID=3134655 RepID=UPI0030BA9BD9
MIFSAIELQQKAAMEPFVFQGEVDVSSLATSTNNDIRQIDPVFIKGMCTVDRQELIFSFSIEGKMILPCARTLVDVPYAFKFDVTEVFSTALVLEEEDEEDEVHLVTDDLIDLTPLIEEQILLKMPFRVFSEEEALDGGEGWTYYLEEERIEEEKNKIDPRLAKLQDLFQNSDQNDSE